MDLNPFRLLRRRRRLRQAIEDEVRYLRRAHGEGALRAAVDKLERPDLTHWGRQIMLGAARRLRAESPQAPRPQEGLQS